MDKESQDFKKISQQTIKLLKTQNGSHGWDHTERVLHLAEHIAKKENADMTTIRYAALLHDICRNIEDKSNGKICHAEIGAFLAREILKKNTGLHDDKIDRITQCIESHRYRNDKKPITIEAKILSDADKLDSIGAVGIARTYHYSGEIGANLHNRKGTKMEDTKPYTEDDTGYREYIVKLRHIKDRMLTKEGKRLASERHHFMEQFFERLNNEIEGKI